MVTELLESASCAVKVLTGQLISAHSPENESHASGSIVEMRKRQFLCHTTEFFAKVKNISEDLSKQIDALEDSGIIFAGQQQEVTKDETLNGGYGNLDVGILNARINGPSATKEAEIYEEAVAILASIGEQNNFA